tara:strand:+ start:154 stop:537 length:384 start_codon:yes stop_codon:yes gene_type:complete
MAGVMAFGQALAQDDSIWEADREAAFLLTPFTMTWYSTKFFFYEFPRLAFYQLPAENVRRFSRVEKSEIASLIDDLNDDDILVKDFILSELKKLTGQSFGFKSFSSTPEVLKTSIRQWNEWWGKNGN